MIPHKMFRRLIAEIFLLIKLQSARAILPACLPHTVLVALDSWPEVLLLLWVCCVL